MNVYDHLKAVAEDLAVKYADMAKENLDVAITQKAASAPDIAMATERESAAFYAARMNAALLVNMITVLKELDDLRRANGASHPNRA